MTFKEWMLLNEDGEDWDLIFPVRANEYPVAAQNPRTLWIWREKLKAAKEEGRELFNIDKKEVNNKYVSVSSATIPDDKPWKHKKDNSKKSSLKIEKDIDLYVYGHSDDFDKKFSMRKTLYDVPLKGKIIPKGKRNLDKLFKDRENIKDFKNINF